MNFGGGVRRYALRDGVGDRDVAAGGVGVRADLVGGGNQVLDDLPVERRHVDLQVHGQAVADATCDRAEPDLGGYRRTRDVLAGLARDQLERVVEAGGETGREQLLGVRAVAGAAYLLRRRDDHVELAVVGRGAAVAATFGGRAGGVEDSVEILEIHGCRCAPISGWGRG